MDVPTPIDSRLNVDGRLSESPLPTYDGVPAYDGVPVSSSRGQRADTWVRPYARRSRGGVTLTPALSRQGRGGRGARERGKRGRLCLRGNDPCRLRPAHQGDENGSACWHGRVDDSSRGLDTGPVSSTGPAFRRYDGCGRLTSIFVPTTVWLPSRLLTFDPRIEYGAGSSTSPSTSSGEPGSGQVQGSQGRRWVLGCWARTVVLCFRACLARPSRASTMPWGYCSRG